MPAVWKWGESTWASQNHRFRKGQQYTVSENDTYVFINYDKRSHVEFFCIDSETSAHHRSRVLQLRPPLNKLLTIHTVDTIEKNYIVIGIIYPQTDQGYHVYRVFQYVCKISQKVKEDSEILIVICARVCG